MNRISQSVKTISITLFILLGCCFFCHAKNYDIIVDKTGGGSFTSISDALNSLPEINFERTIIYVKSGIYSEKILINRDFVSIIGEDKESTKIEFEQLKKDWIKDKDPIGAAVVNISGDDVTIENITVRNTMPKVGPTAYSVYSTGTRTILYNCNFPNNGANTISLMNHRDGMYYIKDCLIEGTVDFLKVMGWCYVEDCSFFQKEAIASIWHAAINDNTQKMVIKSCYFDGVENFFIGRHHYDAEFFILNCKFSERLANKPLYRKTYPEAPQKEQAYIFGDRYYYHNNKQEGTNYAWLDDNLAKYKNGIDKDYFTTSVTFNNKWNPETHGNIFVKHIHQEDELIYIEFNQPITVKDELIIKYGNQELTYKKGSGRYILSFTSDKKLKKSSNIKNVKVKNGEIMPSSAFVFSHYKLNDFIPIL